MNEKAKNLASQVLSHPKAVAGFVAVAVVVVVILQNLEPVTLDFLFWNLGPFSKLWLILGSMVVGAGLAEALRFILRRPDHSNPTGSPGGR